MGTPVLTGRRACSCPRTAPGPETPTEGPWPRPWLLETCRAMRKKNRGRNVEPFVNSSNKNTNNNQQHQQQQRRNHQRPRPPSCVPPTPAVADGGGEGRGVAQMRDRPTLPIDVRPNNYKHLVSTTLISIFWSDRGSLGSERLTSPPARPRHPVPANQNSARCRRRCYRRRQQKPAKPPPRAPGSPGRVGPCSLVS